MEPLKTVFKEKNTSYSTIIHVSHWLFFNLSSTCNLDHQIISWQSWPRKTQQMFSAWETTMSSQENIAQTLEQEL